uniref:CX domain-containing protein n=1 Tax=Acrobeloides nanus TaxID=290746 RepID=A0A914CLF6_9BILA
MYLLHIVICLVIYVECKNITNSFKTKESVDTIDYFKKIGKFNNDSYLDSQLLGKFIGSISEGRQSSSIRCIYEAKHKKDKTVNFICPKETGCCSYGCCLKSGEDISTSVDKYLKKIFGKVIHEDLESKSIKVENKLT